MVLRKITSSIRLLPIKPSHLSLPHSGVKLVFPKTEFFFLSPQTSGESKAVLHYTSIFLSRRKRGWKPNKFSGLGLSSSSSPQIVCGRESCTVSGNLFSRLEVRIAQKPKHGLGFCCPVEERSLLPQPVWPGSGPSSQPSPHTALPAGWVLTFLHGWQCPTPLPQRTACLWLPCLHGNAYKFFNLQDYLMVVLDPEVRTLHSILVICLGDGFRLLLCLELCNTTALVTGCCVYRQWGVLIIDCSLPPAPSTY